MICNPTDNEVTTMSIEFGIETVCRTLAKQTSLREFDRDALRETLKDVLGEEYKRESVERIFNKMLQEGNHAIFVNARGNVELKNVEHSIEEHFITETPKIIITIIEIIL